jgi:TatD DNase family protein
VTLPLPAIDAHAHVLPDVSADDLRQLGAFVFAVTREGKEWEPALRRHDDLAIWGVGVHPGVPAAIAGFWWRGDQTETEEAVDLAAFSR